MRIVRKKIKPVVEIMASKRYCGDCMFLEDSGSGVSDYCRLFDELLMAHEKKWLCYRCERCKAVEEYKEEVE